MPKIRNMESYNFGIKLFSKIFTYNIKNNYYNKFHLTIIIFLVSINQKRDRNVQNLNIIA